MARKTTTSTAVKNRYNAKTYTTINVHVKKETAARFKEKCARENITQSSIFHEAIKNFLGDE